MSVLPIDLRVPPPERQRRLSEQPWCAAGLLVLAGCNLLTGAADLASSAPDTPTDASAATPTVPGAKRGAVESAKEGDEHWFDGGARDAGDAGTRWGPRRVFVTSTRSRGDLGGLAGADSTCNALASAAGLAGTWVAWLSAQGTSAIDRLSSDGPWYLVSVDLAVTSKLDLSNDDLAHPIDRDENGALVHSAAVWTGTRRGKLQFNDCGGWTGATSDVGRVRSRRVWHAEPPLLLEE